MRIFIGKIPNDLSEDMVHDYFRSHGDISSFIFKGQYAFVDYNNNVDSEKVLNQREHDINGRMVIVEESRGRPKRHFDDGNGDMPPRYGRPGADHMPPRYDDGRRDIPQRMDRGYGHYQDSYYDSPRDSYDHRRQPPSDREHCPYCSRCEVHGTYRRSGFSDQKKSKREHPNDVNKFVIEDLPRDISIAQVDDFVKSFGFSIIFSRITARGDAAIVELQSTKDRDEAIAKMDGSELSGSPVHVREFRVGGGFSTYSRENDRNNQEDAGIDIYSGIDNTNRD